MNYFIKYCCSSIIRFLFRLLSFIRVDSNKVLFMSYAGKQYSCNPRAISEYIASNYEDKKLVWVLNNKELISNSKYKVVRPRTLSFYLQHWTAGTIITNGITFKEIPIRNKQVLINTWHGGGAYKRIVYDNPSVNRSKFEKKFLTNKDEKHTVFLSSCKTASEKVIESGLGHKGKILEIGSPRNDLFWSESKDEIVKKVKDKYKIDNNKRILLYAPTFRDSKNLDIYNVDFELILEALNEKFGGEWLAMVRMHQLIEDNFRAASNVISASDYFDMQDLLILADAFLTDYSSSIWDFALTMKPAFLYTPDISEYLGERNFYTEINSWPFEYAEGMDELKSLIMNYDVERASDRIKRHLELLGSFENGNASKKVVDYVFGER